MRDRIKKILLTIRPEFDFDDSEDFIEDGYLDSFDITTLISEFEREFMIIIDGLDVCLEFFKSYDAMENLVNNSKTKEVF